MKFVYASKDMQISESLKARVEKKLGKLSRYFREEPDATIRFKVQKGARNIVEITVNAGGIILRAEESSNDMYLSIDHAVDKLESQIRRHRTKIEKRIREAELEPVIMEAPVYEEQNYDIVRVKKFSIKPMGIEDAITQMELLGHDFFLFMNEEDETMNVLYRRNDGSYGLLKPDI